MNLPSLLHARPRFRPAPIFATPAATEAINDANVPFISLLIRHVCEDCGDLAEPDRQQNELSLDAGLRILSSYVLPTSRPYGTSPMWDRSATAILLPGDY